MIVLEMENVSITRVGAIWALVESTVQQKRVPMIVTVTDGATTEHARAFQDILEVNVRFANKMFKFL